jgi:hypothetical protein
MCFRSPPIWRIGFLFRPINPAARFRISRIRFPAEASFGGLFGSRNIEHPPPLELWRTGPNTDRKMREIERRTLSYTLSSIICAGESWSFRPRALTTIGFRRMLLQMPSYFCLPQQPPSAQASALWKAWPDRAGLETLTCRPPICMKSERTFRHMKSQFRHQNAKYFESYGSWRPSYLLSWRPYNIHNR